MTSHEYAGKLRQLAARLEEVAAFELPDYHESYIKESGLERFSYHFDKTGFLAAVRALGKGRKVIAGDDLRFVGADELLHLSIYRSEVCKLVKPAQPAEYDCEPLLSQAEEAQLTIL